MSYTMLLCTPGEHINSVSPYYLSLHLYSWGWWDTMDRMTKIYSVEVAVWVHSCAGTGQDALACLLIKIRFMLNDNNLEPWIDEELDLRKMLCRCVPWQWIWAASFNPSGRSQSHIHAEHELLSSVYGQMSLHGTRNRLWPLSKSRVLTMKLNLIFFKHLFRYWLFQM